MGERDPEAADSLRRGAEQTRGSVRSLRNLLVEIYPPSLQRAGLRSALEDLLAPISARGIETELDFEPELALDFESEALVFRITQEALRNVVKHAVAGRVAVAVAGVERGTELTVADDGRGFDPGAMAAGVEPERDGHIGTDLMADLASEAGAELAVDSAPGRGTTVRLLLPR